MAKFFDWLTTYVAGVRHHQTPLELIALTMAAELALVREPGNEYDKHAVRVDGPDGGKLGYIPAAQAPWVAALLDHGHTIKARVDMVDPRKFEVTVTLLAVDLTA